MRVKRGVVCRRRHKRWLERASGYWGTRHVSFKTAKQAVIKAAEYAYRDRKNKKREFRSLWIQRINAAVRPYGYTYSQFMHQLAVHNVDINRKMLSELAINNPEAFKELVDKVMAK